MKLPKGNLCQAAIALCILLIAAILPGCGPAEPQTPEEAFSRWLKYQEEKKYDEAWAMMTLDLQNRRGIRGFHVGILTAGWRGDFKEFVEDKGLYGFGDESGYAKDLISRVKKWQVEQKGKEGTLTYTVPYRGFDWRLEADLISDQGKWRVTGFYAVGHLPPGSKMLWIE